MKKGMTELSAASFKTGAIVLIEFLCFEFFEKALLTVIKRTLRMFCLST